MPSVAIMTCPLAPENAGNASEASGDERELPWKSRAGPEAGGLVMHHLHAFTRQPVDDRLEHVNVRVALEDLSLLRDDGAIADDLQIALDDLLLTASARQRRT